MFNFSDLSFITMKWEAKFLVDLLFCILQKYNKFEYFSIIRCHTIHYLSILKKAAVMSFPSHQFTHLLCCE